MSWASQPLESLDVTMGVYHPLLRIMLVSLFIHQSLWEASLKLRLPGSSPEFRCSRSRCGGVGMYTPNKFSSNAVGL